MDATEMKPFPNAILVADGTTIDCSDLAQAYNRQLEDDLARRIKFQCTWEDYPSVQSMLPNSPDMRLDLGLFLSDIVAQYHRI